MMINEGSSSAFHEAAAAASAADGYFNLQGFLQLPADVNSAHLQTSNSSLAAATSGNHPNMAAVPSTNSGASAPPSRYESQKRRDWNTFGQYLRNHRPPLALAKCSGAHVLEFLRYLDQFGKTKVHTDGCPFFGQPQPPSACPCPLRQAWGSLDALIGRLRAAFEENGGKPESNPFGARAVRLYLRHVRETQAKARGIAYEKKKRKRPSAALSTTDHSHPYSHPHPHDHHHHHQQQQQQQQQNHHHHLHHHHQASINTASPSSSLSSHGAESVYSPSSISQVAMNHHHGGTDTCSPLMNQAMSLIGTSPADIQPYHHRQYLPQPARQACPSPPPAALVPSFN